MKLFDLRLLSAAFGLSLASVAAAGPNGPMPLVAAPDAEVFAAYAEGMRNVELVFSGDAQLWLAQSTSEPDSRPGPTKGYGGNKDRSSMGSAVNDGTTRLIVKIIEDANRTCASTKMAEVYRVDCLRVYYGWVADKLSDKGDYAPVKKAMRQAEAKLDRLVKANLDPKAERVQPREGFKPQAKRLPPLRAVKKGATKKVARQAAAVVEEAELIIIRSSGDPARRTPHFTKVAEAVEDNLLILRSA